MGWSFIGFLRFKETQQKAVRWFKSLLFSSFVLGSEGNKDQPVLTRVNLVVDNVNKDTLRFYVPEVQTCSQYPGSSKQSEHLLRTYENGYMNISFNPENPVNQAL
jgi:hypothetical protein